MIRASSVMLFLLLLALTVAVGLGVWGCFGLNRYAIVALQKYADAAPAKGKVDGLAAKMADALPSKGKLDAVADSANAVLAGARGGITRTVDNLNRKCKGEAGPDACGALAQVNKTVIKIGDAVVSTQQAEIETLPHFTAAMDSFKGAADDLGDTEAAATTAFGSFDALMKRKSLGDAIDGLAATSQNAGKISGDLYAWSHPILNPDPCTTRKCTAARIFGRIEGLTGFGASAFQFSDFFRPLSVRVAK
jgi:hypothetical protein